LEFKPTSDDVQEEYKKNLAVLKLIVDGEISEIATLSGGVFDQVPEPEASSEEESQPDLGEQPAWVGKTPPKRSSLSTVEESPAEKQAPTSTTTDAGGIYLKHAKVFRVTMKRAKSSSKVYAELRIGHDDLVAHINDQYVTVKTWEPEYVSLIGSMKKMKDEETGEVVDVPTTNIKEGMFVDVWGKFAPWQSDPSKSDLHADAVKLSE